MKRLLLLCAILLILQNSTLFASHLMGGEITWTCLANGKYVFHVKVYRDCNGVPGPASVTLSSDGPVTSILCNLVSQTDNSPVCNPAGPTITCANPQGAAGAVEEFVFQSAQITLSGVPPATGWAFWYSDCCRNVAITNLLTLGPGFTLRAKMFSYNGMNANPCYDNSPAFAEAPRTVICTGYPFVFNHNAMDNEVDSLVYEWEHPLEANAGPGFNATPIPFLSPYTYNNPLPDSAQNPNNAGAILDTAGGEINFTSFTQGTFVLVVKVTAFKCGQKVAEIFRDIQAVLSNTCQSIQPGFPNNPPILTPPFIDHSTGLQTSYTDTVHAGQNVHFVLNGQDLDADANFVFQYLHLTASGIEFDSTFSNANGPCFFPPCATLSPSPLTYSTQINYAITFDWNPSCDLLQQNNCSSLPGALFTFNFSFFDDFCPIPGQSHAQVKIFVIGDSAPSIIQSADTLFCTLQAASYQWYLNGTAVSGANSIFFVPTQDGNYHVETSHASGCTTTSPPYNILFFSIASEEPGVSINISPNPFNHWVHIHIERMTTDPVTIVLRDIVGKIVSTRQYDSTDPVLDEEYDLADLPAGIYLMQFNTVHAQKTFKLVKY